MNTANVLHACASIHIIGANVNATDLRGQTPLHVAVMEREDSHIKCLLDNKAEVNIPDWNGNTPLDLAIMQCESNAKTTTTCKRATNYVKALLCPCTNDAVDEKCIKALLEYECPSQEDKKIKGEIMEAMEKHTKYGKDVDNFIAEQIRKMSPFGYAL